MTIGGMTSTRPALLALLAFLAAAAGCAFNLADVRYTPVQAQAGSQAKPAFSLARDVPVPGFSHIYARTLPQGTTWEYHSTLPQGDVFRSKDHPFTLECSNVYEAYLVVSGERLIGFYLPVEKGYVELPDPIALPIQR